jgi:hypothetical protein
MTRDDIIRMAREAGLADSPEDYNPYWTADSIEDLERFAALVAAAERAEVERLRALCEEMSSELFVYRASENLKDVTAAIRARGQE